MWNNLIVYIILVQLWVAGEKAQPSIGHMREKKPYPPSDWTKVVACLACWCRRKLFHHPVSNVWRHWWHSRSQISHELSDILLPRTWVCRGLDDPTCSECLPAGMCNFEPPEHVPWMTARARTCALVFRRAPCVPRSREHEKRPTVGRDKTGDVPKNTFTHSNISVIHVSTAFQHAVFCDSWNSLSWFSVSWLISYGSRAGGKMLKEYWWWCVREGSWLQEIWCYVPGIGTSVIFGYWSFFNIVLRHTSWLEKLVIHFVWMICGVHVRKYQGHLRANSRRYRGSRWINDNKVTNEE